MARWTRSVIRHRRPIIAAWLALLVLGGAAAANVGDLLSNRFSVPGSDAERGRDLLNERMHQRADGAFTLVARGTADPAAVEAAAQPGAGALPSGRAGRPLRASSTVVYVQIETSLENQDAQKKTADVREAIGAVPGARTYLTGFPALNHDTQPIYNDDLAKGESIAIPIALIVLLVMFGTLGGLVVPFLFAAVTIPTALGFVWIFAHTMDMAVYVTNI